MFAHRLTKTMGKLAYWHFSCALFNYLHFGSGVPWSLFSFPCGHPRICVFVTMETFTFLSLVILKSFQSCSFFLRRVTNFGMMTYCIAFDFTFNLAKAFHYSLSNYTVTCLKDFTQHPLSLHSSFADAIATCSLTLRCLISGFEYLIFMPLPPFIIYHRLYYVIN